GIRAIPGKATGGASISTWWPDDERAGPAWRLTVGQASADLREISKRVIDARPGGKAESGARDRAHCQGLSCDLCCCDGADPRRLLRVGQGQHVPIQLR